jgi:hypothetical protein
LFRGIGEPKYMPVAEWPALNKILSDALTSYNELNAAMDLVILQISMKIETKILLFHLERTYSLILSPENTILIARNLL